MKEIKKFKNLEDLSKVIADLIDAGADDVSLNIGCLHIPVKPKDKIAIDILWKLLDHPNIKTVGDVTEVLQDAMTWHQLFYIIKHSDEQNAIEDKEVG